MAIDQQRRTHPGTGLDPNAGTLSVGQLAARGGVRTDTCHGTASAGRGGFLAGDAAAAPCVGEAAPGGAEVACTDGPADSNSKTTAAPINTDLDRAAFLVESLLLDMGISWFPCGICSAGRRRPRWKRLPSRRSSRQIPFS